MVSESSRLAKVVTTMLVVIPNNNHCERAVSSALFWLELKLTALEAIRGMLEWCIVPANASVYSHML